LSKRRNATFAAVAIVCTGSDRLYR